MARLATGYDFDGGTVRLLWLVGRLYSFRRISRDVARREYGISQRTWGRDIQRLRAAGFILIMQRANRTAHFEFGGFDPTYAEAVRMGPYAFDERREGREASSRSETVAPPLPRHGEETSD